MSINSLNALVVRFRRLNGNPRMTGIGAKADAIRANQWKFSNDLSAHLYLLWGPKEDERALKTLENSNRSALATAALRPNPGRSRRR